jgi:hypothetical protein
MALRKGGTEKASGRCLLLGALVLQMLLSSSAQTCGKTAYNPATKVCCKFGLGSPNRGRSVCLSELTPLEVDPSPIC